MKIDVSNYDFLTKRLTGQTLKLFFRESNRDKPSMVLELTDIAAFLESDKNPASYSSNPLPSLNSLKNAGNRLNA